MLSLVLFSYEEARMKTITLYDINDKELQLNFKGVYDIMHVLNFLKDKLYINKYLCGKDLAALTFDNKVLFNPIENGKCFSFNWMDVNEKRVENLVFKMDYIKEVNEELNKTMNEIMKSNLLNPSSVDESSLSVQVYDDSMVIYFEYMDDNYNLILPRIPVKANISEDNQIVLVDNDKVIRYSDGSHIEASWMDYGDNGDGDEKLMLCIAFPSFKVSVEIDTLNPGLSNVQAYE